MLGLFSCSLWHPGIIKKNKRYKSFDNNEGLLFAKNQLSLEDLANLASKQGDLNIISGKQELYESIINNYIK